MVGGGEVALTPLTCPTTRSRSLGCLLTSCVVLVRVRFLYLTYSLLTPCSSIYSFHATQKAQAFHMATEDVTTTDERGARWSPGSTRHIGSSRKLSRP